MDDVRVRTNVGAVLTFVSAVLIMALTFSEFFDYMKAVSYTHLRAHET